MQASVLARLSAPAVAFVLPRAPTGAWWDARADRSADRGRAGAAFRRARPPRRCRKRGARGTAGTCRCCWRASRKGPACRSNISVPACRRRMRWRPSPAAASACPADARTEAAAGRRAGLSLRRRCRSLDSGRRPSPMRRSRSAQGRAPARGPLPRPRATRSRMPRSPCSTPSSPTCPPAGRPAWGRRDDGQLHLSGPDDARGLRLRHHGACRRGGRGASATTRRWCSRRRIRRPMPKRWPHSLGALAAGVFSGAVMHTPVEVTEEAVDVFRASGADCGGQPRRRLDHRARQGHRACAPGADQVVIPTTYAGSEMTDILGETAGGREDDAPLAGHPARDRDLRRRPDARACRSALTVTSALNAIAHAMEALYAPDRNPVIDADVRGRHGGLSRRAAAADRRSAGPRRRAPQALYGAWCCSTALGTSRWRCTTSWRMSSAAPSTRRMPRPTRSCCPTRPPSTKRRCPTCCARSPRPSAAARRAARSGISRSRVGAPLSLKDIGIDGGRSRPRGGDRGARMPMPIRGLSTWDRYRELLQAAWEGRRPGG